MTFAQIIQRLEVNTTRWVCMNDRCHLVGHKQKPWDLHCEDRRFLCAKCRGPLIEVGLGEFALFLILTLVSYGLLGALLGVWGIAAVTLAALGRLLADSD